jgi:hypothetical protein
MRMWSLVGLLLLSTAANAHDQWNNGKPIEDWIKKECCANEVPVIIDPSRVHVVWGRDLMTGAYGVIGYKGGRFQQPHPDHPPPPQPGQLHLDFRRHGARG